MKAVYGAAVLALRLYAKGKWEGVGTLKLELMKAAERGLKHANDIEMAVYRNEYLRRMTATRSSMEMPARMAKTSYYRARRGLLEKVANEIMK